MVLARLKFEMDNEINSLSKRNKEVTDMRVMWRLEAFQELRKRISELEKHEGSKPETK